MGVGKEHMDQRLAGDGDHAMLSAVLLTVVLSGTYEFVVVKKLRSHSAKGV